MNEPNCAELCSAFLQGLEIRDDDNSQPSLPPDSTEAPATGTTSPPVTQAPTSPPVTQAPNIPSTGTCLCTTLCQQCNSQGIDNEPCQIACAYASEADCENMCDAYLQDLQGPDDVRDDTGDNPDLPDEDDICACVELCNPSCKTAPCKTVCEIAALPNAECTTKCNAAFHVGEP